MLTTQISINELGKEVFTQEVTDAMSNVEIYSETKSITTITVDELSRQLLSPRLVRAFPEVDLEIDDLKVSFETKEVSALLSVRDISVLESLLTIGVLLMNLILLLFS